MAAQDVLLEKTPPQSQEAEMGILGSCLIDETALDLAVEKLQAQEFYNISHQTIFNAIVQLSFENKTIDLITLTDALRNGGQLDAIGGTVYLTDLIDSVSTTAHAKEWIGIVREKFVGRELVKISQNAITRIYEGGNPEEILQSVETNLFTLTRNGNANRDALPTNKLVAETLDIIEARRDYKSIGIPLGFRTLDSYRGAVPGEQTILAARPSIGKTSLMLQIAVNMATTRDDGQTNVPLIFTLEMGAHLLMERAITQRSLVNLQRFPDNEWKLVLDTASEIANTGIVIDDTVGLTPMQLRAKARRYIRQRGVTWLGIDYLQLMQPDPGKRYSNRQAEVSYVSRTLKEIARELDVPIMVLSQFNREVENRPGRRPEMHDLRESGDLEQNADYVLLMTRPDFYDNEDRPGLAEIRIGKNRNGPTSGWLAMHYSGEYCRFSDVTTKVQEPKAEQDEINF